MTYQDQPVTPPATVEERKYKNLTIEIELYSKGDGRYYAWPYIKKSTAKGSTKQWFKITGNDFASKEEAVRLVVEQAKTQIDAGFPLGQIE